MKLSGNLAETLNLCGVQIASWLIPFPPRINTPKMGQKQMDRIPPSFLVLIIRGKRLCMCWTHVSPRIYPFRKEHGQRWHKPEHGIGSRAGWKRLELHRNVWHVTALEVWCLNCANTNMFKPERHGVSTGTGGKRTRLYTRNWGELVDDHDYDRCKRHKWDKHYYIARSYEAATKWGEHLCKTRVRQFLGRMWLDAFEHASKGACKNLLGWICGKEYDHREAMSEILWQAGATVGDQVGFGVAISRGMCNIV